MKRPGLKYSVSNLHFKLVLFHLIWQPKVIKGCRQGLLQLGGPENSWPG